MENKKYFSLNVTRFSIFSSSVIPSHFLAIESSPYPQGSHFLAIKEWMLLKTRWHNWEIFFEHHTFSDDANTSDGEKTSRKEQSTDGSNMFLDDIRYKMLRILLFHFCFILEFFHNMFLISMAAENYFFSKVFFLTSIFFNLNFFKSIPTKKNQSRFEKIQIKEREITMTFKMHRDI